MCIRDRYVARAQPGGLEQSRGPLHGRPAPGAEAVGLGAPIQGWGFRPAVPGGFRPILRTQVLAGASPPRPPKETLVHR
eukprot:9620200-Alexandrium_andersonii.AAC.1